MIYLYSFLFCGFICLIGQIILDKTRLTPGHITTLFVIFGCFLDVFGIYDKFIIIFGAGASVPITSFGHLLIHGAMKGALENGYIGLLSGIFSLTASGISAAIVFSFIFSFFFKPKD